MVRKKQTDDGILTFDEDSPLFVKKKKTSTKRKPRTTKTKPVEDIVPVEESKAEETKPKRKRTIRKKKQPVNPNVPKYVIKGPEDCKHILPAFKKMLIEKWKLLEKGSNMQASEVAGYIRGAAILAKEKRPKEYAEFQVLIMIARRIAEEENKTKQNE